MGKVASSSVYSSLKAKKGLNVFHVHRLNPQNIAKVREDFLRRGLRPQNENKGLFLYEQLIMKPELDKRIITLVREPISRNISAFFQNLPFATCMTKSRPDGDVHELIFDFLQNYDHDVPLSWFDVELFATTGIDVYRYDFDKNQGYQYIWADSYRILIMRHDLDDRIKEKCIVDFLNLESFQLSRSNESASKKYSDTYANFLNSVKIPQEYAQRMLDSKYARHFYTPEERVAIFKKWTKTQNPLLADRCKS
jgi:hypothetical protein